MVDLSSFYLDILKDRLYTSPAASLARRSAQTVIHMVLEALLKLMAPILTFTAEKAWLQMPHRPGPSVHSESFPEVDPKFHDEALSTRWHKILAIRNEVQRALRQPGETK